MGTSLGKVMGTLLLEDAGFENAPIKGSMKFIVTVDRGSKTNVNEFTVGVGARFKLRSTPEMEKIAKLDTSTRAPHEAAKRLRMAIEDFLKNRFQRVFAMEQYKLEGFSARHPDTGHNFAEGNEYASSSVFNFNTTMRTVYITDQAVARESLRTDDLMKHLRKVVAPRLLTDPLFKPSKTDPWTVA
jgi:hypothetical protein